MLRTLNKMKEMYCPATGFKEKCRTFDCPAFRNGSTENEQYYVGTLVAEYEIFYCGLGGMWFNKHIYKW